MKTYRIWATEKVTHFLEIEAEDEIEARNMAMELCSTGTIIDGENLDIEEIVEVN